MRIAIFSDNFYPELSGISDSIISLGEELSKRGHILTFYAPKYGRADFLKYNVPFKELDLGPNVRFKRYFGFRYPTPTGQAHLVIPNFIRSIGINKFKPDIIHTQDFFGCGIEALFAAKIFGIPIVGTNHTPITKFLEYAPIKTKWFSKSTLKYVSWYYNQCDYVTAPSNSIFPEMVSNGLNKPHEAISNPIRTHAFRPSTIKEKNEIKKLYNLSKNTIIYVGRLAKEKNIDVIIKAISLIKKDVPDVTLALTGHGTYKLELENLVKKLELQDNVNFVGTIDEKHLPKIYHAAEIFTITSTAETQCIGMMQAMASGIPVIGVNHLGLANYINEKNGYLIKVGDFKTLAKKIVYLFKNPTIRKKLGKGGYIYVQNFSASKIADKWEELYNKVITNKKK